MKQTTLCYLERDGKYLMLHRVKKENDASHDKWIGVGGKCEADESPARTNAVSVVNCHVPVGYIITKSHLSQIESKLGIGCKRREVERGEDKHASS